MDVVSSCNFLFEKKKQKNPALNIVYQYSATLAVPLTTQDCAA